MREVAEGFSAARASRRKRTDEIAAGKARFQVGAAHEFMQESCVETVARPDRVNGLHGSRRAHEPICPTLG